MLDSEKKYKSSSESQCQVFGTLYFRTGGVSEKKVSRKLDIQSFSGDCIHIALRNDRRAVFIISVYVVIKCE